MKTTIIILPFLCFIVLSPSLCGQGISYTEANLGFSPGEIELVSSPDPQSFEDIVIPTFRGLLRLGIPRLYYSKRLDATELSKTGLQRKNLDFILKDGLISYFSLVYLETAKETINLEEIRAAFRPGTALEDNNPQYAKTIHSFWAISFRNMGAKHLKPDNFGRYFCPDQSSCLPLHMPRSSASYQQKLRQARWGGNQGEFAEMRAFGAFMDNEAQKLIKWANGKTPTEVYFVGRTTLGEYNFEAGGFVLKGLKPVTTGPVTIEYNEAGETSLFKPNYTPEGQRYQSGILVQMSPEKAEIFINDLNSRNKTRQLYYVYKARLETNFSQVDLDNTNFHKLVLYTQIPASRTIEFFSDNALSEKVFELEN